jgi:hypothetical protein
MIGALWLPAPALLQMMLWAFELLLCTTSAPLLNLCITSASLHLCTYEPLHMHTAQSPLLILSTSNFVPLHLYISTNALDLLCATSAHMLNLRTLHLLCSYEPLHMLCAPDNGVHNHLC